MSGSELDELMTLRQALEEARAHVYRQRYHGRHEQDRIDAEEWWSRYKNFFRSSQEKTPSYQDGGRGGEHGAVGWHNTSSTVSPESFSECVNETPLTETNLNDEVGKVLDSTERERESQLSLGFS